MPRQIQVTVHLDPQLLERLDRLSRAEETACNKLTGRKDAKMPRSRMLSVVLKAGLAAYEAAWLSEDERKEAERLAAFNEVLGP